jgi:hypothetical protein
MDDDEFRILLAQIPPDTRVGVEPDDGRPRVGSGAQPTPIVLHLINPPRAGRDEVRRQGA